MSVNYTERPKSSCISHASGRLTAIKRIGGHGGVGIAEGDRVDGVGHIELRRERGVELVDVAAVPHDALAVRDVEVTGYLVNGHLATDGAALVLAQVGEVFGAVVYALGGVT